MKVTHVGQDFWLRDLYKSTKTGIVYVEVDGYLHNMSSEGEPETPLVALKDVEIVKENSSEKE